MGRLKRVEHGTTNEEYPDDVRMCSVPDCDNPVRARKLCAKHHQRMRRTGDTKLTRKPREQIQTILKMIEVEGGIMENQKSYGIVRSVDELGRFVIPKEYSLLLGSLPGLPMEYFYDDEQQTIMLCVHNPGCYFCGSEVDTLISKNRKVCRSCIDGLMEDARHDENSGDRRLPTDR